MKIFVLKIIEDNGLNPSNWYYHSKLLIPTQEISAAAVENDKKGFDSLIKELYCEPNGELKDKIAFIQIIELKNGMMNVVKNIYNKNKFPF
jgi:hypothetical protein